MAIESREPKEKVLEVLVEDINIAIVDDWRG
jgi:hypothetical protein